MFGNLRLGIVDAVWYGIVLLFGVIRISVCF